MKSTFINKIALAALLVVLFLSVKAQEPQRSDYKIMFYNVENLFDTVDDTTKWDEQFLPDGDKHWTPWKYKTKLNNIAKVLVSAGGWQTPAVIGLCEVENAFVLEELTQKSPLKRLDYKVIHKESPDKRGIDVALLYQKDQFRPIYYETIPIHFPKNPKSKTRDILYVKGLAENKDTLHIFVNHWPSRWGGQMKTEHKRMFVASRLRHKVDSLFSFADKPNIVIMGDFNDAPTDKSVLETLKANPPKEATQENTLYNLLYPLSQTNDGTHPYQGHWAVLDHIIVSNYLLDKSNKIYTTIDSANPFRADFLLEDDKKYGGKKTFRTYIGFKYNGGFSDHLPVVLDLYWKH